MPAFWSLWLDGATGLTAKLKGANPPAPELFEDVEEKPKPPVDPAEAPKENLGSAPDGSVSFDSLSLKLNPPDEATSVVLSVQNRNNNFM